MLLKLYFMFVAVSKTECRSVQCKNISGTLVLSSSMLIISYKYNTTKSIQLFHNSTIHYLPKLFVKDHKIL